MVRPAVLVTGGAGYVGSHACKGLAIAGYWPVAYDNLSRGHRWAVKWGPLEVGDLQDSRTLAEVLARYRIEAVLHLAAYAYVDESVRAPQIYFRNNVAGTLSLLETMLEVGVKVIVFSSTCATFGTPRRLPIAEDHPQEPVNPYGESKLLIEKVLRWYGETHKFAWAALRYFNAAGGDLEGGLGEDHDPETHLIPLVIQAALRQRPGVEVYGTDYDTPDGTCVRDYVHVADLADAHVKALEYLLRGERSMAFNLGIGRGYSVREVISAVESVSGARVAVREMARRSGDVAVLIADASRAASALAWYPRWRDLGSIIDTAWRWHAGRVLARPPSRPRCLRSRCALEWPAPTISRPLPAGD
jgi:UDP-arabinose 4-epimerase